jgi:hypothetical protein
MVTIIVSNHKFCLLRIVLSVLREDPFEVSISQPQFKKWMISPQSMRDLPTRLRAAGGTVGSENRSLTGFQSLPHSGVFSCRR